MAVLAELQCCKTTSGGAHRHHRKPALNYLLLCRPHAFTLSISLKMADSTHQDKITNPEETVVKVNLTAEIQLKNTAGERKKIKLFGNI